jgi:hypothetical protein
MRFRAEDLRLHGWNPPQILQIPDWCGCSTEYLPIPVGDGWAADPDLGPQPYGDSAPAPRATRSVLGGRPVILRLTPKTAAPVGECVTEWHFLEKQDERDGGQRGAS